MSESDMAREQLETRRSLADFLSSKSLPNYPEWLNHTVNNLLQPQSSVQVEDAANTLLDCYKKEEARRKQYLRDIDGKISLVVDILSSKKDNNRNSEYLSLTAYFIDNNWEMNRWVLSCSPIESFSAELLLKTLKDWNIENKIICTITMASSNRCDELFEFINCRIIGLSKLSRVYCCADVVNLIVKDAYDSISKNVDRIGKVYSFETSCSTWKDRNDQLTEALIYESAGHYSTPEVRLWNDLPSEKGWEKVSSICQLIEDIYTIVFPLFEMGYPVASIFLNRLQELHLFLIDKNASAQGFLKNVTEKMLERLKIYMKEMNLVLAIASVLDPRFKMEYIKFSSSKFNGNLQVGNIMEAMRREYAMCFCKTNDDDDVVGVKLLREYKQLMEVELYLKEPVVAWSDNFCPLKWWKDSSSKYPNLSRLARDFIGIPMTIAVSNGALEMEQRKVEDWMIPFKPDHINAFMCI